jgi:hypothetical protein
MGVEIERKFLVDAAKVPLTARAGGSRFAQGYLSLEPTVRVRLAEREGEEARAWITVKGPGGLTRAEFEYPIPPGDARAMLGLCVATHLRTTLVLRANSRHVAPIPGPSPASGEGWRTPGGEMVHAKWKTGGVRRNALHPKRLETTGPFLRQRLSTLPPRRGKGRGWGPRLRARGHLIVRAQQGLQVRDALALDVGQPLLMEHRVHR